MRAFFLRNGILCGGLALVAAMGFGQENSEEEKPEPPKNQVAAKLDIANSKEGSYPGGSTPIAGQWSVDAIDTERKELRAAPRPLLDSWLEFGPEVREKGATILATGRAPGAGRLKSRFAVGLHGKNGFQLRVVPARQEVELVRRGAVLLKRPFPADDGEVLTLELSVLGERNHWIVSGRVWSADSARPEEALFEHKIFASELLFPLAGRSVLVATPFSGEAVSFREATVYHGAFVPEVE